MDDKVSASEMPGPGRSRRRLNVSSPPKGAKVQKISCSPVKKNCKSLASADAAPVPPVERARGVTSLDRRLTRSASKRWLKIYESSVPMQEGVTVSSDGMLPPSHPVPRVSTSAMVTRHRYRTQGVSRGVCTDVNKISQNFFKRLSFDQISNTSDYGTASEHSRKCSVASGGMSPVSDSGNSCHCASISGVESLGTSSGDETNPHANVMDWADKPWVCGSTALLKPRVTVHRVDDVAAFIPDHNRSQHEGEFKVSIRRGNTEEEMYRPSICSSLRVHHVSPVVSMEPHGVQFFEDLPVVLIIPLSIEPSDEEWISCLYSNTEAGHPPKWERLPRKDYSYRNGSVVININHFSLFTVVLEEPYPEIMRTIRRRTGGRLLLGEVPGVEVEFPHGSLDQDLDAYLRVLYNHEPNWGNNGEEIQGALASPVIMLGPHGHAFSTSRKPVRIKLPIPHYHEIRSHFGSHVGLSVWQSSTSEGEPTSWQRLEPSNLRIEPPVPGLHVVVVSFTVHHFSFFKVVWDLVSTSLTEAKMGMSYFYPYISFSMMCQAFMEESKGDSRFGLEVICYRSDKRLPEQTNYRHRVGASTKPKLVRPGRILVRLKSQMFEADVEAGEDAAMSKEEPDFRGRDFEKQYACRFKQNVNVESGTFGKVVVERMVTASKNDPLFEFNLNKTDAGHEVLQPMGSERWTAFAMKEMAASLQITEGSNWKRFAQHIGFTKSEIKTKFQYSPDPFLAIMNTYGARGGTPEEFMQALYAVSRDLNLSAGMSASLSDVANSSQSSTGSKGSGSRDSGSRQSRGSGNRFGGIWGYRPWGQVNPDSDSDSTVPADAKEGARKRSRPSIENKNSAGGSSAKRRKFSDVSETVSSGSEGGDDEDSDREAEKSNNKHISNKRRLSDRDMWKISKGIARKDWRFLGRTLGIEERVLVDLEHQYQPVGFRECAYQMLLEWKGRKPRKCTFGNLYGALLRENMVEIAKHMVKILPEGEEEARERDFND